MLPGLRRRAAAPLLLWPAVGLVILFTVVPLVAIAVISVLTPGPWGGVEWRPSLAAWQGLALREDILSGQMHWSGDHLLIYGRSVLLALATTLLTVLLGLPMAWFIATRPPRQRNLWLLAVTVPFWTSLLLRSLALMLVLGDGGLLNGALLRLGLVAAPVQLLYTDAAVLSGLVSTSLPFMVLPVYAALARIDLRVVEAAADLHASRSRILRRILWPLALPGIGAGSVLVFVPTLGAWVVPMVLGGGRAMMIGDLIALQFGAARNWPLGAAEAIALLMALLLVILLHRIGSRRLA